MDFFGSIIRGFFFRNTIHTGEKFEPDDHLKHGSNSNEYEDEFREFELEMIKLLERKTKMFESFMPSLSDFPSEMPRKKSPRSYMLKDDGENEIFDSYVWKDNFKDDLSPYQEKGNPNSFSYSTFSSVKTVQYPDGVIEEHKTYIDSDGNAVTTISRSGGDTTHDSIKSDNQVIKEIDEGYYRDDVSNVEEAWKKLWDDNQRISPFNPSPPDDLFNMEEKWRLVPKEWGKPAETVDISQSNPSYWSVIKKFFLSPESEKDVRWC